MEIVKMVDLETLTEAEKELIESGEKTAEDFLAEYEQSEATAKAEFDEKLKKAEELSNNQKIRAEKAESQLKEKKGITSSPNNAGEPSHKEAVSLTREEAILFAKGLNEKEVERAQKIAQVEGIKLTEAVESDLFTSWKKLEDEKVKNANANLPPSKGSKSYQSKTFQTQGLTEQEHKELFKAKNS